MHIYHQPLEQLYFTAIDFETTGLYPDRDRIIEIGAVKFNLRGDEYRFSGLINPGIPIPEKASSVNGIFDHMVVEMPILQNVIHDFIGFIEGTVLVAHNIGFDAAFLTGSAGRMSISLPDLPCIDTVFLAKKFFKGLYSYSLGNIAKELKLKIENAHRAEDDADACRKIFTACLKKIPDYNNINLKDFYKLSGHSPKSLRKNY